MQKNKKRISSWVLSILLLIGFGLVLALYSYMAYITFKSMAGTGYEKMCMFQACNTALMGLLFIGIMRSSTSTKHNDSDFLLSLPIKKSHIILSKALSKYSFDFSLSFLFLLPYLIFYMVFCGFSFIFLVLGILLILLLPLLSVGISYIIDFIIARLFNKTKFGNIFKTIIFIVLFVGLLLVLTLTNSLDTTNLNDINAMFATRPITNILLNFLFNPSFVNILLFLVLVLAPFVIGMLLFALNFGKTFAGYQNKKSDLHFTSGTNGLRLLIKKEIKKVLTSISYLLNSIIGLILILILSGYLCFGGFQTIVGYLSLLVPAKLIPGLIAVMLCSMLSTTQISASAISLEGKNWWFIKSSPIKEEHIILSKALTHIIIALPVVLISSLMMLIFLKLSFINFIIILLLPAIFVLISAFSGVLFNLLMPKFDYQNENQVVKNGMSATISLFTSMIIAFLPIGVYLIFPTLSLGLLFAISLIIYILILSLLLIILFTKGKKIIKKL